MTRKEFIKICGLLGIGLPLQASLSSCSEDEPAAVTFDGKVIIIGAGAGGLSAGYLLQQQGIDFQILEASSQYGGRMRINTNFADFPIPLGAEWLEGSTGEFRNIVNDSSVSINIDTVADDPDRKFINSSWFSFFEEYILPSVRDKITYNEVVESIDYTGDKITVITQNGQFTAEKAVVSVPLQILKDGDINFSPALPDEKTDAIKSLTVWEGFKAFFEFEEKFYPEENNFNITPKSDGEKIYYDATFGQNTTKNILGLFVVGKPALNYLSLTDNELKDFILGELDQLYDQKATPNYIKHISQNWNNEPFIRGGYLSDHADWRVVKILGNSVAEKIYFAGGAYTDGEDWVSVHLAAKSAKAAVNRLLTEK